MALGDSGSARLSPSESSKRLGWSLVLPDSCKIVDPPAPKRAVSARLAILLRSEVVRQAHLHARVFVASKQV